VTDTPAEVAEALTLADAARKEPVSYRGVAYAEVPTVAYDTIRAHIAELERQLAEVNALYNQYFAAFQEKCHTVIDLQSQLAAQRERDGRALKAIRQRLHCTSYRLGEDIIDIIDAALKERPTA
jgi:argininosuccinate lyase